MEKNDKSRREFLKSAGKMAIYTPPAIMLLMKPSRQALACASLRPRRSFDHKPNLSSNFKPRPKFKFAGDFKKTEFKPKPRFRRKFKWPKQLS